MYSALFLKIITSMDSSWLELSNGILFVIFRYRLTHFPFLTCFFSAQNRVSREESQQQEEERGFLSRGAQWQ
jgi:hypothetical protein